MEKRAQQKETLVKVLKRIKNIGFMCFFLSFLQH